MTDEAANRLGDVVREVLAGTADRRIRAAAARGALPLPRTDLVRLWVALCGDEDEEIRFNADANLKGLDPDSVCEVLAEEQCTGEVIEFFAPRAARDEKIAEKVAFHKEVPTGALATLAEAGTAAVCELVLTNQERLLSQPGLLDKLSENPALRADQRGRILELLERAMQVHEAREQGADEEELEPETQEVAKLLKVDIGELFAASEIVDGEEFEQAEEPEIRDAYKRILVLNTAQKAILAMRGGREERMILIRDSNRLVCSGVLKNPRITEDDIESFARMRGVNSDVLRGISQNREWLKSYSVIVSLVNNPKTPQGVSTNLVNRLRNNELKLMRQNHDVPELIRRMARRTLETRTQQSNKLKKK